MATLAALFVIIGVGLFLLMALSAFIDPDDDGL